MGERMKRWFNALPWMARTVWKEGVVLVVGAFLSGALAMFIGLQIAALTKC